MCPFVDFFGRVKDKAGDVERILKEKDRHGTVFYYRYLFCKSSLCVSADFSFIHTPIQVSQRNFSILV